MGCRRRAPAREMVRVAATAKGELILSRTAPGRGAWLCRASAAECARTARRRRAFGRALRSDLVPGAEERLMAALNAIDLAGRSMESCSAGPVAAPPGHSLTPSKG